MGILLEEFDQFAIDQAGQEPICEGAAGGWTCRNPHRDSYADPPSACPAPIARDVRCDGPAKLLGMIDATHAPSWGYPAAVCPSHWLWAIEHWKTASQHPVGAMDETGTWSLW